MKTDLKVILFSSAFIFLTTACAKKDDDRVVKTAIPTNAKASQVNNANTTVAPKKIDVAPTTSENVTATKLNSEVSQGAATPQTTKEAQNGSAQPAKPAEVKPAEKASDKKVEELPKVEAKVDSSSATKGASEVPVAKDSDEIVKSFVYKLTFKDLDGLMKISQKEKVVLYNKEIIAEDKAMAMLPSLNEENFCKVVTSDKFNKADYLKLEAPEMKELDKEKDLYQTTLTFKNSNGTLKFICAHPTNHFYVEDFYKNVQNLVEVRNTENKVFDVSQYTNPITDMRIINAMKIKDPKKLEKVILSNSAKDLFALSNGEALPLDTVSKMVDDGKKQMSCVISEKSGPFLTDKVYFRVALGVAEETPREVPTASVYAVYRADATHALAVTCFARKTAAWSELINESKGILEFGVLRRPDFTKPYKEMIQLHEKVINGEH